jgi:hypothetical protein
VVTALVGLTATVLVSTVLGACASSSNSSAGASAPPIVGSSSPTAPTSASPPASPQPPVTTAPAPGGGSSCPENLVVPSTANSRKFCVAQGGTVTITAVADQAQGWSPFEIGGNSLAPAPQKQAPSSAAKVLAVFTAVAPGTSTVSSAHRNCPVPAGGVGCNSILLWQVTIAVK